ncbi:MAG: CooT family nickel-binding protein [Desulfosarcinaceae bacterium]|nr:CooT family nickel-binding protein [Desulfosarcinaceae bacterium]
MCDVKVVLVTDGVEKPVLSHVDEVRHRAGQVRLTNIFGEEKTIRGDFLYFNNSDKKMVFAAPV